MKKIPKQSLLCGLALPRLALAAAFWTLSIARLMTGLPRVAAAGPEDAENWPQFHGPNAAGVAPGSRKLPEKLDTAKNLLWKVPLPPGHSSPAVHSGRLFITGARGNDLLTIAVDLKTAAVLWERQAPHENLEEVHSIGSHAQPSPAADGSRVVSFFGSSGLSCHDRDGKLLWHKSLGAFKNNFGAGSSPILVGDRIILNQDHDLDSFLAAFDAGTGERVWKTDRSEFLRGYATPVLWENAGRKQIVVSGTLRLVGYDLDTGKEAWTIRGMARLINMTPVAASDGNLYAAGWTSGGDTGDRFRVASFSDTLKEQDGNANGSIESSEIPEGPLKSRFPQIDRDKDGRITREEWDYGKLVFDGAQNAIIAVKPGGTGDITVSHVVWRQPRHLPYVPSPVYYGGAVFMVRSGGILASLDARTGEPVKEGRISAKVDYYASPVAGDGKLYLLGQNGELTVVSARPEWQELSTSRLDEASFASPAIAGGRIYIRTLAALYCFGESGEAP